MLKILLNAGTSPNTGFVYGLLILKIVDVKITKTRGKSAGVYQIFLSSLLAFAQLLKEKIKNRSIHTSIASQRLHAGDLKYAYIVGLFEGDGYFSIAKKGKYLTYELGIELSIRDVQLIYKIKSLLTVGLVSFRKRKELDMVSLRIRNKNHLKNFILPIFDKYPMLSNKQYDYLRFKDALISDITYSEDLPKYTRSDKLINSTESIINTPYFSA